MGDFPHVRITLRFSGGVKRRPLQPVVMPRTHAPLPIRGDETARGCRALRAQYVLFGVHAMVTMILPL